MKRILPLIWLFIYLSSLNYKNLAQSNDNSISGYVKDISTGEPLVGVNVFLSGTFWGTTTDSNGYYIIKLVIPGEYEIVSSMIGYEPMSDYASVKENNQTQLDFFMKEKVYKLNDVTVQAELPEEWYDQLDLFKKYFLGRKYFAEDCIIENEIEIDFYETDSILTAMCDNPIRVVNNALGYRLDCILLGFDYNKNTGGCTYIVKSRFTEMVSSDADVMEDWEYNREEAYFGSLRHFLVSLVNGKLVEENFWIIWSIMKSYTRSNSLRSRSTPDIYYYRNDSLTELLDSAIVYDSQKNEYQIKISEPWYIDYYGWISTFHLPQGAVTLNRYGYPKQLLAINVLGDWAKYGVAEMLPEYYELKFENHSDVKD